MTPSKRKSLEPFLKDEVNYYEHQITGVRQMARMQNFLLADDMGLGKSLQALTVGAIDFKRDTASSIIVVCPVSLRGNWADEIVKFTNLDYMLFGQGKNKVGKPKKLSPAARSIQLQEFTQRPGPKILITNYEQIKPHLKELNKLRFDIAIFDEAHYMKNYKSARTKASLALLTIRSFLLTGTPMLNQVNELWPLLHKIAPHEYPKYWSFINRYCVFGGYQDKQIIGVKNEKELTQRLQGIMIRRLKADVLDLPEVQIIQRRVDLLDQQKDLYDKVIKELEINIHGMDDPAEIENALTKFLRLKQICGTTFVFTGEDNSSKLDLAIEDAIEIMKNGHKIVVFTQFRPVLEAFCQRLEDHGKKNPQEDFDIWELHGGVPAPSRQGVVNQWSNDAGAGAIVCMLQVAGIGLNMVASRHALFIDKLFVPGLNQQAIDRLHRIGQNETQAVQVYEYICRNTIENRVEQILTTKKKLFGSIVNESDFTRRLVQALLSKEEDD